MKIAEIFSEIKGAMSNINRQKDVEKWLITHTQLTENDMDKVFIRGDEVDILGDVVISCFLHEKLGFKFGNVKGDFRIVNAEWLNTLEGCPHTVDKNLIISNNNRISSLKGAPNVVNGSIHIRSNPGLDSLEGFPTLCAGHIAVTGNFGLKSVEGLKCAKGPSNTDSFIDVRDNVITSFEGFPKKIHGYLDIGNNMVTSFVGIHESIEEINHTLYFSSAQIKRGGIGLILIKNLRQLQASGTPQGPWVIIEDYLERPEDIYECQAKLIEAGYEEYAEL